MARYSPGYVRKRGKIWYAYYSTPGAGERGESSGSTKKGDAQALLARRIAERDQGLLPTSGHRLPMRVLLEALERDFVLRGIKSLYQTRQHLKPLAWFSAIPVSGVTEVLIDRYIVHRQTAGCKPATINYELGLLGQALRLAHRRRQIPRVPLVRRLPVSNVRQGFFSAADVHTLCQHLTPVIADLVQFAFVSGWRRGEILTLEWRDIDWAGQVIRLRDSKTGVGRVLPFNATLAALLARRQAARTLLTPYVFHREGRPVKRFDEQWTRACTASGVPGRVFHDLRRSAALAMRRAGIPPEVVMRLMGHRTMAMHQRYLIVDEAQLREAMQRLDMGDSSATHQTVRALADKRAGK